MDSTLVLAHAIVVFTLAGSRNPTNGDYSWLQKEQRTSQDPARFQAGKQIRDLSPEKVRFRPTDEDLTEIAGRYSNCAIALACGVSETTIRKWLGRILGDSQRARSADSGDIPSKQISALRSRAQLRDARSTIASSRRLTKERVGRVISKIGEEAEIVVQREDPQTGQRRKYASAHDLRRGCAQRLINAGVSAETLMVLMRHKAFATTQKFYGATRAAQSAAAEIHQRLAAECKNTDLVGGLVGGNAEAPHLTAEELQKLRALLASI